MNLGNLLLLQQQTAAKEKSIKIVLQWHSTGVSPKSTATITSTELLSTNGSVRVPASPSDLSMTVPMQRGSMAVLPSRSRFMITDILGGGGAANVASALHMDRNNGRRSPSPQSPRDLSASAANNNHLHHLHHNLALANHHHHHHHLAQHSHLHRHDEDSDDSSGAIDDDNSVCSNGKLWKLLFSRFFTFSLVFVIWYTGRGSSGSWIFAAVD